MTYDEAKKLCERLDDIAELMEDEGIGRGDWCDAPVLRAAATELRRIHDSSTSWTWRGVDHDGH